MSKRLETIRMIVKGNQNAASRGISTLLAAISEWHINFVNVNLIKNIFGFLRKPFPNRPANLLRCSPVTAVRPVLCSNLHSDCSKFLLSILFCFFGERTAVILFFVRFSCPNLQCFAENSFPLFSECPSLLSATPTFLPDPFVSFTDIFPRSGKSPTLWGITPRRAEPARPQFAVRRLNLMHRTHTKINCIPRVSSHKVPDRKVLAAAWQIPSTSSCVFLFGWSDR